MLSPPLPPSPQAGRVYIAITSKGYPSRYIYGSPDGSTRGILAGTSSSYRILPLP